MLTLVEKLGRGFWQMLTLADKEGGGRLEPPFLADIICEQPLNSDNKFLKTKSI